MTDEDLYRLLRQYQDGELANTQVSVGNLTPKLTVVFDALHAGQEQARGTLRVIEDLGRKLARPELDPSTRLLLAERIVTEARAALGEPDA